MIIDCKTTTSNCTEPLFLHSFGLKFIVHVFWILEPMFHELTCCVVLNFLLQLLKLSVLAELSLKIILYSPVYSFFGYHQPTLFNIYSYRTESFFFLTQFWIESYCSCFFLSFGYWNRCSMCLPVMLSPTFFYNHWNYPYRLSYRWK